MEHTIPFTDEDLADLQSQKKRGKIFSLANKLAGLTFFFVVVIKFLETDMTTDAGFRLLLIVGFGMMLLMLLFSFFISKAMRNLDAFIESREWLGLDSYARWMVAAYALLAVELGAVITSFAAFYFLR